MRTQIVKALIISLLGMAVCSSAKVYAQTAGVVTAPGISTPEIVSKMMFMNEKRAAALKSFTSHRTYDLEYSGFPSHKHAKMEVDVTFNAPRKELKIVSEEGSELLRNHVLHKLVESEMEANDRANKASTALTEANYEFSLRGEEQKDGRECYVLEVKPRTKSKFLYEGTVWVDSTEFAVVHIQAHPAKNPSFWVKRADIEHRYEKVGFFWLPASNRSASSTRLGGHAVLAIDYGQYHLEAEAPSAPEHKAALFSLPR
jgi:hypothetical protein